MNLPPILLAGLASALASCDTVQPQGALKQVIDGDVFSGAPVDPAEEKAREKMKREHERQVPAPVSPDGPVKFKIEF